MAKNQALGGVWTALMSPAIYKRTQGKRVRQTTAGCVIAWVVFGCFTLYNGPLMDASREVRVLVPLSLAVVASWIAFRVVNIPQFADFLIAVEAEMKKVAWPSLQECFRAAAVVIVTMFLLAAVLFLYDQLWMWFFHLIGVLRFR
jgi:preprotein translocase subunit SecE